MKKNTTEKKTWQKNIVSGVVMIALIFQITPAFAHNVTVFAWSEGDTVFVESKFAGGKKVKGGEVIVSDLQGTQLLTGKTNEQGEFSFKIPRKTAMKIVLVAGMGHQGEWTIPIEDIELSPATETKPASSLQPSEQPAVSTQEDKTQTIITENESSEQKEKPQPCAAGITSEDIQIAVEKALDKKLKPLIKMVAESQTHKPSLTDIIGGIGYILGLMGIAAYFNSRRKK